MGAALFVFGLFRLEYGRLIACPFISVFIAAGPAAYAFFSRTTMNLREKEDAWAAAFGGFMCGGVLGLPCKNRPSSHNKTNLLIQGPP